MPVPSDPIERQTGPNPSAAIIWLHGLGAGSDDFVPLVDELQMPSEAALRFVFPQAPSIPVTGNGGYVMPAWYDIYSFGAVGRSVDETGIAASRQAVRALIEAQCARGIPPERIVIGGFSQGAAMAYMAGLTHADRLGGIVALSGYVPAPALLEIEATAASAAVPIFIGHGDQDDVVPIALGEQGRQIVANGKRSVSWRAYAMAHEVSLDEIGDLRAWLLDQLFPGRK